MTIGTGHRCSLNEKLTHQVHAVELWRCEWENPEGAPARKVYLGKIGEEQPLIPEAAGAVTEAAAICWSYSRTLGNIAVFSNRSSAVFPKGPETMRYCHVILSTLVNFGTALNAGGVVRIKRIGAQRGIRKLWIALGKCDARTTLSPCTTWSRLWPSILMITRKSVSGARCRRHFRRCRLSPDPHEFTFTSAKMQIERRL